MMRLTVVAAGLFTVAMQIPVAGQAVLQAPMRLVQGTTQRPPSIGEAPIVLPQPDAVIDAAEPTLTAPQTSVIDDASASESVNVVMPVPAGEVSVAAPPATVDFDQILSDYEACGDYSQCASTCCSNETAYGCEPGCEEPCCFSAYFGLDPCVPPPPIGNDPLYASSFEDLYRTPDHYRGLWETYPAEKMQKALQHRRSRVPPPPCTDCGPQLVRPAWHPIYRNRCEACSQYENHHEPNCTECRQAVVVGNQTTR